MHLVLVLAVVGRSTSVPLRVSADINAAVAANKPHVQELHTLFSELSRRHARTMLYLSEVALHCFPLKD